MKLFPALLTAAALSAGATAGLMEILRPAPRPAGGERGAAQPARTGDGVASPASEAERTHVALVPARDPLEADRVRQLEERVAQLERWIAQDRRPVAVPESPPREEVAALDPGDPEARRLVLDVMAAEEARRDAEREARRAQERLDALNRRAERVAERAGLNARQSGELVELWLDEKARRDAARETARGVGFDGAREAFRAIDEWLEQELIARFGFEGAAAIREADRRGGRERRR